MTAKSDHNCGIKGFGRLTLHEESDRKKEKNVIKATTSNTKLQERKTNKKNLIRSILMIKP
ncbi:hypothetical protein Lal_00027022 [Lupinus albus]|nr:hypothetical protein Lal_00027022 [Lupinus albus]